MHVAVSAVSILHKLNKCVAVAPEKRRERGEEEEEGSSIIMCCVQRENETKLKRHTNT
jgi:hypothetical protein